MRSGAILREQLSFARLRPQGDIEAKLKELKAALDKEVKGHARRRDVHRSDRMGWVSLELNRLLFYHAPRTGPEFADDGNDTFEVCETYAFDDDVFSSLVALTEATEAMKRKLTVRWGSAAAGTVGDMDLALLGKDRDATAGWRVDRHRLSYGAGDCFDNEAFQPQRQADGWRSVLKVLDADRFFTSSVGEANMAVFADDVAAEPVEHRPYVMANLELDGKKFQALMHTGMLAGGNQLSAKLSTADLSSTRESLDLFTKMLQAARETLGPPSDVTLEFSFLTSELPTYAPLLRQAGSAFPLVSVLMPYKKGFRPLAVQQLGAGQIRAYPLLILKRYAEGMAPIWPMLAVNAVHTEDGMWVELQTSQRPDLVEQAAAILGGEPEFWQGTPETRWNWYPEHTWPGLPHVQCAPHVPGTLAKPADVAAVPASSSKPVPNGRATTKKTAGKSSSTKPAKAPKKGD